MSIFLEAVSGSGLAATQAFSPANPQARESLVTALDAVLPQTQCQQCGYPDCRAYAQAMASDNIPINRCPPGGEAGIAALAGVSGRPIVPLDTTRGTPQAFVRARIEEDRCIGCTLCLTPCPVDAILGAPKRMHTVLESECTGCGLCLPPCPMDCIVLVPAEKPADAAAHWRTRRMQTLARQAQQLQAAEGDDPGERVAAARERMRAKSVR